MEGSLAISTLLSLSRKKEVGGANINGPRAGAPLISASHLSVNEEEEEEAGGASFTDRPRRRAAVISKGHLLGYVFFLSLGRFFSLLVPRGDLSQMRE